MIKHSQLPHGLFNGPWFNSHAQFQPDGRFETVTGKRWPDNVGHAECAYLEEIETAKTEQEFEDGWQRAYDQETTGGAQ